MRKSLPAKPSKAPKAKRPRRRKGEGGLTYRDDKKLWQFEVSLPPGPNGQRRKRTLYGRTEPEVKRKLADLVARGGGTLLPSNPTTVADYVAQWMPAVKRRVKMKTVESYEWAWRAAEPHIGAIRLDKFDRTGPLLLFEELQRKGKSANTVRHVARVMGTVLSDAIADGKYIGLNPFKLVSSRKPKHSAERGRALSIAEAKRFLKAARSDEFEAAWILGLTAGLRIGETFGLKWEDVDLEQRSVHVKRQALLIEGKVTIDTPKTRDSVRLVPIGTLAVDALRRLRRTVRNDATSGWLFPSSNPDLPVSPNLARRRNFSAVRTAAKIEGNLTPHDLRHSMNSFADAAGVPEKVRSERMGHADSAITRVVYTHTIDGQAREAATKIDALLQPVKAPKR